MQMYSFLFNKQLHLLYSIFNKIIVVQVKNEQFITTNPVNMGKVALECPPRLIWMFYLVFLNLIFGFHNNYDFLYT